MYHSFKIFGVLFCILIFLSGCRKDPSIPIQNGNNNCKELPTTPQSGWNFTTRNPNLNCLKSQYDPVSSEKIYYLSDDTTNRYLLSSLSRNINSKIFIDSKIISYPILNKNGWITFSKTDFNIYKIKSTGDSLVKLTTNGISMNPVWDMTGNYIYFNDANNLSVYRMTKTGILIDTLKNINSQLVVHDSLFAYLLNGGNSQSLYIKNSFTNATKLIETNTIKNSDDIIFGFFFDSQNSSLYYYDLKGLYKVNIANLTKTKIINSCPTERRLHYTISYVTNKIMATQISTKQINSSTLYNEYDLVEFDNDGSNPIIIKIP